MRARLLDLGEVGAVRSQSVYHAVAAAMGAGDDPAVILSRPVVAFVSVADPEDEEVDADLCRRRELPVVRRRIGRGAALHDPNQILFQLVLPAARAGELGLPADARGRGEALARPLVEAYRKLGVAAEYRPPLAVEAGSGRLGSPASGEIGAAHCFAGSLVCDLDPALAGAVRAPAATSIAAEAGAPPALAAAAEALIESLESAFGLELIPSMPTPAEMDSIYDWDRKLTRAPGQRPGRSPAASAERARGGSGAWTHQPGGGGRLGAWTAGVGGPPTGERLGEPVGDRRRSRVPRPEPEGGPKARRSAGFRAPEPRGDLGPTTGALARESR